MGTEIPTEIATECPISDNVGLIILTYSYVGLNTQFNNVVMLAKLYSAIRSLLHE